LFRDAISFSLPHDESERTNQQADWRQDHRKGQQACDAETCHG
jgi:hypothetical protein